MLSLQLMVETWLDLVWVLIRVSGVVLIAPIFGAALLPLRIRVMATLVLSIALLPSAGGGFDVAPLSAAGIVTVIRELLIGLSIGLPLRIVVDGSIIAGQIVSTGMGLSFANVVDPQHGGMPMLGRLYLLVATLLLMAVNGHLILIGLLAQSYELLPVGQAWNIADSALQLAGFGGQMFVGAASLALPCALAIVITNVSFGVISRAAPTLNLFAVGFPVTLLMGFVVLVLTIRTQGALIQAQFNLAFERALAVLGAY